MNWQLQQKCFGLYFLCWLKKILNPHGTCLSHPASSKAGRLHDILFLLKLEKEKKNTYMYICINLHQKVWFPLGIPATLHDNFLQQMFSHEDWFASWSHLKFYPVGRPPDAVSVIKADRACRVPGRARLVEEQAAVLVFSLLLHLLLLLHLIMLLLFFCISAFTKLQQQYSQFYLK